MKYVLDENEYRELMAFKQAAASMKVLEDKLVVEEYKNTILLREYHENVCPTKGRSDEDCDGCPIASCNIKQTFKPEKIYVKVCPIEDFSK